MEELIKLLNFNIAEFSPTLKEFIYTAVANDELPLGAIFEMAQENADDKAVMDRIMSQLKEKAVEVMPVHLRPFIKLLN